jgi:hypothetical protein
MKWKNRKLYTITYINVMAKDEGVGVEPVWAADENEARRKFKDDADWAEIQSVTAGGMENWEPVTGPDLPPVRDGLLLLRMERDYEMLRFADGRSCTAWVRVSERSWQDYSGRSFEDTEITIAVPAAMTTSVEVVDSLWASTITDWRKNYIDRRQVTSKIVGDAFIVTINWLMDLS